MLLGFEKDFQAMVTQFSLMYHCSIRWRLAYEFFSVLYYVHCTVFKQSKSSLTELSTICNINIGNWFSNPLSREAVVFLLFHVSLQDVDQYGWPWSSWSSRTFAFMQTAWSFTLFLLTFFYIFSFFTFFEKCIFPVKQSNLLQPQTVEFTYM